MKWVMFTDKELETLLWAVQSKTFAVAKDIIAKGESTSQNETVQILNDISNKAYAALTIVEDKEV